MLINFYVSIVYTFVLQTSDLHRVSKSNQMEVFDTVVHFKSFEYVYRSKVRREFPSVDLRELEYSDNSYDTSPIGKYTPYTRGQTMTRKVCGILPIDFPFLVVHPFVSPHSSFPNEK